jgi:hypothetical protein
MKSQDQEDKPITIVDKLKYYIQHRYTTWQTFYDKYMWYVYTKYIMDLVREELLWEKMVAEKGKDNKPIYTGICVLPNVGEDQQAYRMSGFTGCDLQCEIKFAIQTSRTCRMCYQPLKIASYNKELMKRIYYENIIIDQDHGECYITKERFHKSQQEVNEDEMTNYEHKWSPMFGIRKGQWMFPLGHAIAKRKQCKPSGWVLVLKKRYQKEKYGINDFDHYYLDPFDNGTFKQDITTHDESTKPIDEIFITGPQLGRQMNHDSFLHESSKDPTKAQSLIHAQLGGLMRYCRRLQPYRPCN